MDVEKELMNARMRAEVLAARRVQEMQAKLRADGRADRAAMNMPDPTPAEVWRNLGVKLAVAVASLRKAIGNKTH